MGMVIKIFAILLSLFISIGIHAQQSLVIYHVNGSAMVKVGNDVMPAKRGGTFKNPGTLQLKPSSSVMLVDEAGRSLQLEKPGDYSFQKISELLKKAKQDELTRKFFAYVYQNFLYKKKQEGLNVAPVVYRDKPFMISPAQYSIITSDSLRFVWRKSHPKATMRFILKTGDGEILIDSSFRRETVFNLNFNFCGIPKGKVYQWQLVGEGNNQVSSNYNYFLLAYQPDPALEAELISLQSASFTKEAKQQIMLDLMLKWESFYNSQ